MITSWNPSLVTRRIYSAPKPAAEVAAGVAKAASPKITGRLAGGIRITGGSGGFMALGGPVQIYQLDASQTPYAHFVTGGTRFMEANPFIEVAAQAYRPAFFANAKF